MSEPEETPEEPAPKKSKLMLVVGLVATLALSGGAFFAVYSGMVLGGNEEQAHEAEPVSDKEPIAFVEIDPMIVSLGPRASRQLRFRAQPEAQSDVSELMPRIVDVLNSYLRAVELAELENPVALIRIRAQMLRRVRLVTGGDGVRDLLITEFVFG